jgi:hypothetical protein
MLLKTQIRNKTDRKPAGDCAAMTRAGLERPEITSPLASSAVSRHLI